MRMTVTVRMWRFASCFLFIFLCSFVISENGEFVKTRYIITSTGGNVTIQYTSLGVPFITAQTEEDLFFAQGKIVAENRIWQMEFFRRYMLGTLSEIFGNITLQSDLNHRRMRWVDICTENLLNTPPEYVTHLQYNQYFIQVALF